MPSETEGRITLALQAYISNQTPSLRATANTYHVPFETLRLTHGERRLVRVVSNFPGSWRASWAIISDCVGEKGALQ
jgi:hypothetical protein